MSNRKQLDSILSSLKNGQKIQETLIKKVCDLAKEIFKNQPNLIKVSSPVKICGDIHGQFEDLLELFKIGGFPPYSSYVFLGDYVDRGRNSVETFLLLLVLKIKHKNRITLLRGNHESKYLSKSYGFYDQCIKKYGSLSVWNFFTQVFDYLPLSAVVNDQVFCVHGGISPDLDNIKDIFTIDRIKDIPTHGPMCDLLWSDPGEIQGWAFNVGRGAGYIFGRDTVNKFCHNNSLTMISRAHQLVLEGYKFMFNQKLVTVWSAPNYVKRCSNFATIMELDENMEKHFKLFEEAPTECRYDTRGEVAHYFL